MSDKFKYAPGKPGIGTKGTKGEDGLQGLSMYFTDYNPDTESIIINSRIENNQALWSINSDPLPNSRIYVTGDIFFDSEGRTYEIDASNNTFTYTFAGINLGGLFLPLGISTEEAYQRYFNSNTGEKYIIDNVYTTSMVNYTNTPTTIYKIAPKEYTRIEYTNVKPDGSYNAFTTYTIGGADNQALAIVYDESTCTFRIGNLDDNGNVRNTNLSIDVSSLIVNRSSNPLNSSTASGNVLTNYELQANSLFDPNFDDNPDSFYGDIGTSDCSIFWNLRDFTSDSTVTGDLYFYEYVDPCAYSSTYRLDASVLRPLIFSDLDASGVIKITSLNINKPYAFYIKLNKNGWTRRSDVMSVFANPLSVNPTSYMEPSLAVSNIGFAISSTVPWTYAIISNPGSFIETITDSDLGGAPSYDGSIVMSIYANVYDIYHAGTDRMGIIRVSPATGAGLPVDISVYQVGYVETVTIDVSLGSNANESGGNCYAEFSYIDVIKALGLPVGTVTDVSIRVVHEVRNDAQYRIMSCWDYRIKITNSSGTTTLYDAVWPTSGTEYDYNEGYLDSETKYINIHNIASTDWPLLVTTSGYSDFNDTPISVEDEGNVDQTLYVSVYPVVAHDVSIVQTSEYIKSNIMLWGGSPYYRFIRY